MANWSDLKASVAEVIKTNGNQEITGKVLQNTLNSIVSNLGENATFAGIAKPTTNPGVPDGNVFYLAGEGTYPNFSDLVIETGQIGVFIWKGSWNKQIIQNPVNVAYADCYVTGDVAEKKITLGNFVLSNKCRLVIRMVYGQTASSATMNINNTGAKPLYYNGKPATGDNSWKANEILDVYYDGTNYQAVNIQGSSEGSGIILDWNTDAATTRKQVEQNNRKIGIQISYNDPNIGWITERYIGTYVGDSQWGTGTNWVRMLDETELSVINDNIEASKKEIADINYSINKWDNNNYYRGFYSGSNGEPSDSDQYISTNKIYLKSGETLQCGYSTDVDENGNLKDYFALNPTFVTVWDEKGNFLKRYGASDSLSFPYKATNNCVIAYTWYADIDNFRLIVNKGIIIISDSQPTQYVEGGTSLNPGIKLPALEDYYTKEDAKKEFVTAESLNNVNANLSNLLNLTEYIEEVTLGTMSVNTALTGSNGNTAYGNRSTLVNFTKFNPSTPVKLSHTGEITSTLYSVWVYSEPSEDATERHLVEHSGWTFDASAYPNCPYFRFDVSPSYDTSKAVWSAAGKFDLIIKTEDEVKEESKQPINSGAVFNSIQGLGSSMINEIHPYYGLSSAARFLIGRSEIDRNITGSIYYLSSLNGNNENNGTTKETAFKTLTKALSMLVDGDTLLIERGSEFRDEFVQITNRSNIKISAYGIGENPIIQYLSILTDWEKVEGRNYIYRCSVHVSGVVAERGMTQVYLDGKYMTHIYDTNDLEEAEAMTYLDEHPNESSWCSCGKYSDGWEAQSCYYYVSLADSPSNHRIEANCWFRSGFIGTGNKNFDIRHLTQRGSGYRDGYSAAFNTYFEDCQFLDTAHHGIVYAKALFLDCTIKSEYAVGYQYHFLLGTSNTEDDDLICANCKVINGQTGSAFSGHGTGDGHKYSNYYIENCYVEGCNSILGDISLVNHVYVYNLSLRNAGYIRASAAENKLTIHSIFGTILQSSSNNGLLISSAASNNLEIINARIKIIINNTSSQGGYSLLFKGTAGETNTLKGIKISNSILEWQFPEDFNPSTAIFVAIDELLDNADLSFKDVIFASNKDLLLGRAGTVHLTNSVFENVILAGVDKSDVTQDCIEITRDKYNTLLIDKVFCNNNILCDI